MNRGLKPSASAVGASPRNRLKNLDPMNRGLKPVWANWQMKKMLTIRN